MMFLKKQNKL